MRALIVLLAMAGWITTSFAQQPDWIWHRKTDEAETRYFRKSFTVQATPSAAEIFASADDGLDVFLNGEPILSATEWSKPHKADVKTKLKAGRNVLAIRAFNGDSSPAGVFARLTITSGTQKQIIVTDANWKAEDRELKGWNQPVFDDAAWPVAQSLGKLGIAPWGDVLNATSAPQAAPQKREATAADGLYTPPGFKVELLHSAEISEGSWVNLCKDDKGRLIVSPQYANANPDGGLIRLTLGSDGKISKREFIAKPLYDAQGMVFAYGSLWVVVNRYSTKFESGLYRITDDGTDTWNQIQLVKALPGGGEHGPHAVELGPDGNLWVMAGNHTKPPQELASDSPHKNYREDHVLPRQPDGNGHATGIMAPGGYILRVNKDATKFELFCGGFRNQFDFAFNSDGELFVYDADMEWDWGMPWYRPTRVNHAVSGAEFGWRYGTGKWPDYSVDSLGAVLDIGVGCPTGVSNGKGAKFPAKYQKAIYVLDWTYGRLMAVHLEPQGASYTSTWENFVCPAGLMDKTKPKPPLNLTDAIIGNDGAMYFTIGGRGTAAGIYRVTYTGGESTADAWKPNPVGSEARALRRRLETFHGKATPGAVDTVWPHLNSPDRSIRYAARIALEAQPIAEWQARALEENSADGGLTALLALARVGDKAAQDECLKALAKWPLATLPERQQLDKIRLIQVSLARHGLPSSDLVQLAISKLSTSYPNKSPRVNRELSQVLIALGAPDVVGKTLALMAKATSQEEMIHYLFHLRTAKNWTREQRQEYFNYYTADRSGYGHQGDTIKWFLDAGRGYDDGASFNNFFKNFLKEAVDNLTPAEKEEWGPKLASIQPGAPQKKKTNEPFPPAKQRPFVRNWTTPDLGNELSNVEKGRNFQKGRQAFVDAQCLACHRFGTEGGGVGPDLTAVNTRFKPLDILESILDPSKVVSEQFQNTTVVMKDGDEFTGRLVDESAEKLVLIPNQLEPDKRVELKKAMVASRSFSKLSPMPTGLVDGLSREDILDLIAFLESGGQKDHSSFKK